MYGIFYSLHPSRALRQLPTNMTTPPSYRKVNPADAPILLLALQSDTMQLSKLDDIGEQVAVIGVVDAIGAIGAEVGDFVAFLDQPLA